MRVIWGILVACFCSFQLFGIQIERQAVWQQKVNIHIQAELIHDSGVIMGFLNMTYMNESPDTLRSIWMHIWPNAYRDNSSGFAKQLLDQGSSDFYFSDASEKGSINGLDFSFPEKGGLKSTWHYHPIYNDVVEVKLSEALLPGKHIQLSSPFIVKLPKLFSRSGISKDFFAITQWYPKPAVYDVNGWNVMPYLDQGEFYSEFCDSIRIELTVPFLYKIAASGNLVSDTFFTKPNGLRVRQSVYIENKIHDFAWFASPDFICIHKKIKIPGSDSILIEIYGLIPDSLNNSTNALKYTEQCIAEYSRLIGPYPYRTCKVVLGPQKAGEGMEYPTISICKDSGPETIFHEVGHNWFYGIMGNNERLYPWMDESINTYFTGISVNKFYPKISNDFIRDSNFLKTRINLSLIEKHSLFFSNQMVADLGRIQPLSTPSDLFLSYNYGAVVYGKGPLMFAYLNQVLGDSLFLACVKEYYNTWKYRHPLPDDMQACFEKVSGKSLEWFFKEMMDDKNAIDLIHRSNKLIVKSAPLLDSFFNHNHITQANPYGFLSEKKYNNNGQKIHLISFHFPIGYPSINSRISLSITPVIGYNYYDNLYAGLILSHHLFNQKGFQFICMPVYSFSQKTILGYSRVQTTLLRDFKFIEHLQTGIRGQSFSLNAMNNLNRYYKLNPFIKLNFKNRHTNKPRQEQYAVLNVIHTGLYKESIALNDSTFIRFPAANFFNYWRGSFVSDNHRIIHRYGIKVNAEFGSNYKFKPMTDRYFKAWINAIYKYRFAPGNKFFRTEFFAGVFLLGNGNIARQSFYMSSNNGSNDYTFSEVLIGRSESSSSDAIIGKQLINSGGNMRNLIPLNPSDRWMTSVNIDLNLPGIIPVRMYLDLGFYSYRSKINGVYSGIVKPELYYTGGMVLGIFKNTLEVFIPFVQSKQFKGYSFWNYSVINSIGFKLNLNRFEPSELLKNRVISNQKGGDGIL